MNCYHQYFRSLLLTAFILLTVMQPVQAQPEPSVLTLSDSIALALENNPVMKIAKSSQEKATWSVKQAEARHGVSLGYDYTLARTDQPPSWYNNTTSVNFPAW